MTIDKHLLPFEFEEKTMSIIELLPAHTALLALNDKQKFYDEHKSAQGSYALLVGAEYRLAMNERHKFIYDKIKEAYKETNTINDV